MRKIGGTTICSISYISQLQNVQDDNNDFVQASEIARRLMEENRRMVERQHAAHEACVRNRDVATANIPEERIDETERRT